MEMPDLYGCSRCCRPAWKFQPPRRLVAVPDLDQVVTQPARSVNRWRKTLVNRDRKKGSMQSCESHGQPTGEETNSTNRTGHGRIALPYESSWGDGKHSLEGSHVTVHRPSDEKVYRSVRALVAVSLCFQMLHRFQHLGVQKARAVM